MKQAPAWNQVVKDFHGNTDVVFGDVSLSKHQVRTIHGEEQSPGAGGWPTVRYFNKETGYGGKPYAKKTDGAMCDELGLPKDEAAENYMQIYVEEAGGTSLCSVKETKNCSDQQKTFIEKWSAKPEDDKKKQLDRVTGMLEKDKDSLAPEALKWVKQRIAILKQFSKKEEL